MTTPAPETIIREALLPENEHHHRCSSQVGQECDCFYGSRRDGRLAHDALDALVRERDSLVLALEAERHCHRSGDEYLLRERDGWQMAAEEARDQLVEARAENERLRIRYGSFLDWAIGYISESEGPYFERLHDRLTDERAALAAAQEPPAEPVIGTRPGIYALPVICARAPLGACPRGQQEPPAEGGDRA